jgi:hypothetical protein
LVNTSLDEVLYRKGGGDGKKVKSKNKPRRHKRTRKKRKSVLEIRRVLLEKTTRY